jgi:hypothetical protein
MAQETFSNLKPIQGETFSSVTPIATQAGSNTQPGFAQRFLQSFGAPSSQAELEASAPTSVKDALIQGLKASTAFLPAIVSHAKQAAQGLSEGAADIRDAGTNIAQGGPIGANLGKAASGALHATLQATPVIGAPTETAGQDVSQGNYAGAAGGLTGVAAQILAPKAIEGASELPGKVKSTVTDNFLEPKAPVAPPELPSPVSSPLQVDTALSDAQLRKLGAKDLTPGGRETLRNAAGPVIQAGSSPELHLIKAIPEINSSIAADGAKLDSILKTAGPLPEAPAAKVSAALDNLRDNLPGGQEETLGKAIDKEQQRYADALKSTDPQTLNQTIRDLDERISDYSAPENQLEGPASVRDAALVTIRRELRSTLNDAIPASKSVNASPADSLDARAFLRRKYGSIANDSSAASAQYQQQLQQGQAQLQRDQSMQLANDAYAERLKTVQRNKGIAKGVGAVAAGAGLLQGAKTVAGSLIK